VKIEGTYAIPAKRETIFALLVDENVLRRCVPGVQRLVRESENRFAATLDVGLGAVQGTYEGTVTLSERVPPERLEITVDGKGKLGFVQGKGLLRLETVMEAGSPLTRITYQGDVQVGGSVAAVGQRMIQAAAKMMIGQFFAAIEGEAKAAQSEKRAPVKHGPVRNFLRWLRSIIRDLFRRQARSA
jgi:carbon monoxide dehydrogenase subunit G